MCGNLWAFAFAATRPTMIAPIAEVPIKLFSQDENSWEGTVDGYRALLKEFCACENPNRLIYFETSDGRYGFIHASHFCRKVVLQ